MKLLIIWDDNRCERFQVEDIEDAQYWFERRIEKEGWAAENAILATEWQQLPASDWERSYYAKLSNLEREEENRRERAEYERLKKKFEDK